MNIGDDALWGKLSFGLFLISFCLLLYIVLTQETSLLVQDPLSDTVDTTTSKSYFTSGVVESVNTNNRTIYLRLQTFCTLSAQYDTLLYPKKSISVGDFLTVSGNIEEFSGKQYLQVTSITE